MNYGDTIYYVNEILKLLENSLKLELDAGLTGEHLTTQLLFADRMLTDLYDESGNINGLSHYEDTLRAIMKSKYRFSSFLGTLRVSSQPVRSRFHVREDEAEEIRRKHDGDIEHIEAHFADKDNLHPPEDLVSQEEFRCLFGSDDSE